MKLSDEELAKLVKFLGGKWEYDSELGIYHPNHGSTIGDHDAILMLACLDRATELGWYWSLVGPEAPIESTYQMSIEISQADSDDPEYFAEAESAPLAVMRAVIQLPEAQ